jgi:hypothetical protein
LRLHPEKRNSEQNREESAKKQIAGSQSEVNRKHVEKN